MTTEESCVAAIAQLYCCSRRCGGGSAVNGWIGRKRRGEGALVWRSEAYQHLGNLGGRLLLPARIDSRLLASRARA